MKKHLEKIRCSWVPKDKPFYMAYHDKEWGVPIRRDKKHFELLCLECMQAGLSWELILKKRSGYRAAFYGFDIEKCANMNDSYLEKQLKNPAIVRNQRKLAAIRTNAQVFLAIQRECKTFNRYVWRFVNGKQLVHQLRHDKECFPTTLPESVALAKDLKKRGMRFTGPTTMYAYMQSAGLVNDHFIDCFRYQACLA